MTMTDEAAEAGIFAASRALHLPTIRTEASRMADDAIKAAMIEHGYGQHTAPRS